MGFYCPIEFKDNLTTIEPRFPKNLRTNEARSDFTGPYKKKCRKKLRNHDENKKRAPCK